MSQFCRQWELYKTHAEVVITHLLSVKTHKFPKVIFNTSKNAPKCSLHTLSRKEFMQNSTKMLTK